MWPFTLPFFDESAINKVTAEYQLELYAFLMTDQIIDLADSSNQTQLIRLLYTLDKPSDTTGLDYLEDIIEELTVN